MELQDRSRLYPNLAPAQGGLVIGSDGRLQYAALPQSVNAPSAPPAPQPQRMVAPQVQVNYQVPAPVFSPDASDAQASLNRWAKWVRIFSVLLLVLNLIMHVSWAVDMSKGGQPLCKFYIIGRVVLFLLVCVTAKTGIKASKLKTTQSAKCFIKMLVFTVVTVLVAFGIYSYKMMGRFRKHKEWKGGKRGRGEGRGKEGKGHRGKEGEDEEEGRDHERNRDKGGEHEGKHGKGLRNLIVDGFFEDNRQLQDKEESLSESGENNSDSNDYDDSDDRDDSDDHWGKGSQGRGHHRGKNHGGHRDHSGKHESGESNESNEDSDRDDSDDSDDGERRGHKGRGEHRGKDHEGRDHEDREHEGRERKSGRKHRGCHPILCVVGLVIYSLLMFFAIKLYRAARSYEELVQRGNVQMVPGMQNQPVLAYAPGMNPAHIPMGAPINQ